MLVNLFDYVDVLAIVAYNLEKTVTSEGKTKIDVSLTDKTLDAVRFTLWEERADILVDVKYRVVAIRRAYVDTYSGSKFLGSRFYTDVKVRHL